MNSMDIDRRYERYIKGRELRAATDIVEIASECGDETGVAVAHAVARGAVAALLTIHRDRPELAYLFFQRLADDIATDNIEPIFNAVKLSRSAS